MVLLLLLLTPDYHGREGGHFAIGIAGPRSADVLLDSSADVVSWRCIQQ